MARNSIILNGKSSDTITGLIIQELPPISKPLMRSQVEEIDGRDGDIITKLGFSAYDKEISVGLYGNFDINEIIAYFNSEGTVTFSNEPDKFYYYQILEQIDFERLVRFRTATINFHVQPFKYSTTEEAETIEAGTVSGEGNNLVLENTSDNPFSKLTPKGDTFQQTYSGKNLLDVEGHKGNISNGITPALDGDGSISWSGTATSSWAYLTTAIPVSLPAGTYTLSIDHALTYRFYLQCVMNDDTTYNLVVESGMTSAHTTFAQSVKKIRAILSSLTSGSAYSDKVYPQLEVGSAATSFEKFVGGSPSPNPDYPQDIQVVTGEQTVKVTGKNLFLIEDGSITNNGVVYVKSGGEVSLTGAATANSSPTLASTFFNAKANTTYTLSANNPVANSGVRLRLRTPSGTISSFQLTTANASVQWTPTDNTQVKPEIYLPNGTSIGSTPFIVKPMLELGSTATAYEPYQSQTFPISLGTTELAKIGTYQDYIWKDGDTWKVHKEISKYTLNGSESWLASTTGGGTVIRFFKTPVTNPADVSVSTKWPLVSNYFTSYTNSQVYSMQVDYGASINVTDGLRLRNKDIASVDDFKTWLSTHNTAVYYALATPTDTAITDETLISQLEALNAAHAYKGRTHIISTAGSDANLPHIIEAKVLGSSDTTITNAGNFISKPKFTIYGSGNIGLYINGIQILQIALGDEQYITIDAAQMEAYKDTLDNLKNRLVTGDYTNLALNPGENQISFSGSVEKYIVENYSRWL